jgi:hypothetical protein
MTQELRNRVVAIVADVAATLNQELSAVDEPPGGPFAVACATALDQADALLRFWDGSTQGCDRHARLAGVVQPNGCPVPIRMDHAEASHLCVVVLALSERVNHVIGDAQTVLGADDYLVFRRKCAGVMGYLYTEFLRPLWRQHPDLEPSEMRDD